MSVMILFEWYTFIFISFKKNYVVLLRIIYYQYVMNYLGIKRNILKCTDDTNSIHELMITRLHILYKEDVK